MANTLTNLIPDCYAALDVVSRELVGFIPAVARSSTADRVAQDQTLRSVVAPANTAGGDVTPAMALPSAADQTLGNQGLTISKSRFFPFSWNGEQSNAVEMGPGFLTIKQNQIAQAMRAAVNEIELDLAVAAAAGASRAYGTAGTTPFASNLADTAQVRKILDDNGAPLSDRHLVIDTTAGAKMRTLTQLTKANEAADATLLRQGVLLDVHGFALRESAKVQSTATATGANYLVDNVAGYAIGATTIHVDTGTGTIPAGSMMEIGGHKYLVTTGFAGDGDGDVVIAAPGLVKAAANNDPVTVISAGTANCAFSRNAIVLATRLPAIPQEGDMAIDRMVITDPVSGLSFEIAAYPGYRMITYHILVAWGVKVIKPEHIALLLG